MNKYVKDTFDTIKSEEASYRQSVENALWDYRRTMEKAKSDAGAYKDEAAFIDGKKAAARREAQTAIQLAETAFTVSVDIAVKSLRDDLHQHLTTRPSAAFIDALRLYNDFDITPSHAEIEALMSLNGGNALGYRAINRTLEKTGAEWRVDAPDSTTYESDIAALERLAEGHLMCAPREYYHEASAVFEGEPRPYRRTDGSYVNIGYKWDYLSVLTASSSYEDQIKALDDMAERWSSTVLPSLKHITAYTADPETGETAAQQMAKDIKATATAPEIEPSMTAGEQIARKMAEETVKNYEQGQKVLEKYIL